MDQIQIQNQYRNRLEKANYLVTNKKVRRSSCKETRNIWMVSSYSRTGRFYRVMFDAELDEIVCDCKAFEFSPDNSCLHILACAIYEGSTD